MASTRLSLLVLFAVVAAGADRSSAVDLVLNGGFDDDRPTQTWETAPAGANSALLILQANVFDIPQSAFRVEFDNAFFVEDATCAAAPTVLCLNAGRFRVIVNWQTSQEEDDGFGRAVPLTVDSGYFWFFDEANVELVAKLHDACPSAFNRYWFFAAGLTDVAVVAHVHDTGTNVKRTYSNAQGHPFAPIQDTLAFDTCP